MAESRIDVVVRGEDRLSPELAKIESKIIRTVGAISAALAAVQVITFPIDSVREFERELANVKKTTEFSSGAIKQLGKDILELSTQVDVSAVDLAKIAAAAGQQGLGGAGREGILQFTESVARMASVLDITAEQAGTNMGKVMNIFRIPLQQIERAVSAFNETSNNSTANGEELLDVVKRIGDAASNLKLNETLGLAATGIDFGFSPEVVGTSVTKIFSDMKAQATEFGRLMNVSATEWINLVETDGVAAFRQYVARLRQLDGQSRQQVIQRFSGDGRIGALVTKFVNDTTNSLLEKNLQSATNGLLTGNSAIKEQQTVLNTLDAQLKILGNTVRGLAIGVGDETLAPVTRSVAQLIESLKSPEFKSFAVALGQSFASITEGAAEAVKWVASLNINWENFIQLATIFVGLKLGQIVIGMASNFLGLSSVLQSIANRAKAASTELEKVGKAGAGAGAAGGVANASGIVGLFNEIQKGRKAVKAARDEEAAAAAKYNQSLRDEATALANVQKQKAKIDANATTTNSASADIARQSKALADAQQAADKRIVDLITARNAKALAIDQKYQADVKAINAKWQADLATARATGDRKQVIATNAHYKALLAETEAAALKQIANQDRYYKGLITSQEKRNATMLAQEKALYAQLAGVQAAALNTRAADIANGAAGSAALATASANAAAAKKSLDDAAAASARTSKGFLNLSTVVAGVGIAFRSLTSILFRALGIFGLVYTVLDAFGALDFVGGLFQRMGEAIGFSTKEKQKAAVAARELKEAQEKEAQRVQDLISKYEKLRSLDTGRINFAQIQNDLSKGATQDVRNNAAQTLVDALEGATAKMKEFDADAQESQRKSIADLKATNDKKAAEMKRLEGIITQLNTQTADPFGDPTFQLQQLVRAEAQYKRLGQEIEANNKKIQTANELLAVAPRMFEQINEDAAEAGRLLAGAFTPETFEVFTDFGPKVEEARKRVDELTETGKKLNAELAQNKGTEKAKDVQAAIDQNTIAARAANGHLDILKRQWEELMAQFRNKEGVAPELLASLNLMSEILFGARSNAQGIRSALDATADVIRNGLAEANGSTAGTPVVPQKGSESFSVKTDKSAESEARKLAKARIALAHAEAEAEQKLKKETNDQLLNSDEDLFQQGLLAIETFYDERKRIQTEGVEFDIASKQRELAVIQDEIANAKEESARVRFQADATRVQGEINVLNAKRQAVIDANNREMRRSADEFNKNVISARNDLVQNLVMPAAEGDVQAMLQQNLDHIEKFYNQVQAQALKNNDVQLANLAVWLRMDAAIRAVTSALVPLRANFDDANRALSMMSERLQSLAQNGRINNRQLEVEMRARTQEAIGFMNEQIAAMEQQLRSVDSTSVAYRRLQLDIEDARNQVLRLSADMNRTALQFNQGIEGAWTESWQSVLDGTETSLNRMISNFGKKARAVFADIVAKDFANSTLQALGLTGSGGFGGLLQDGLDAIFGGGQGRRTAQNATSGIANAFTGKADGSRGNPFYVILSSGPAIPGFSQGQLGADPLGLGLTDAIQGVFSDNGVISKIENAFTQPFDNLFSLQSGGGFSSLLSDTPVKGIFAQEGQGGGFLDSMSGVFDGFLDGMQGAFGGFGDSLTKAFSGLGDLFTGGGSGGGLFGLIAGLFHGGGVVGSGGGAVFTHPAIFQHARRFHTGGLPGLRAGEVPAILQKGEEVITAQDARHSRNGGAEAMRGGLGNGFQLTVDPAAINMTLREWLEGELARINSMR